MYFQRKRWIRLLAALMVLGLLTGCGRTEGQEEEQAPIWKQALFSAQDRKETRIEYQVTRQFSLEGIVEAAILETGIASVQVLPKEGCKVTFYSQEDGEAVGSASLSGDYATCEIRAGRQDEVVVFLQPSSSPKLREVWMADSAGNCLQLGSIDFSDLPETPFSPEVKDINITEDGTVFLWYSVYILAKDSGLERHNDTPEGALYQANRIYVLDEEGRLRGYASEPERIISGKITAGGYEVCVWGKSGWFQKTVDADGKISEQTSTEAVFWMEGADPALCWNQEETAYYVKDNALWKFDDTAEGSDRVFDLASFGLLQEEICDMQVRDGGQIEILFQREGKISYLCMQEGESEVTVLTLADIGVQPGLSLYKAVTEFNRTHQDCRVEIIDYHDENNTYDEAVTRFQLDLARGNAPDLLVTSSVPDGAVYSEKGMLCDLYAFMERDSELNRETVVPSVLRAYEENGGLYVLAPNFVLATVCGPKSIVGDKEGLSLKEFQELLAKNPNRYLTGFPQMETALMDLLRAGMDDFIDWEKGTCNFDCEEFQELLEFIKEDLVPREYVLDSIMEGNAQLYQDYRSGKIMLKIGWLCDVCDYSMMKELFGEDVTLVGYPTNSGSGTCVNLQPAEVSIMKASQNQDRAWEFLKFYCMYINPEPSEVEGFSILSSRLEEQLQESQTTRYTNNEFGEREKSPRRYQSDTFHTINYYVYEATKEDADVVARIIESSDTKYGSYSAIFKIILEECAPYLAGDKKASEVSRVIQGRLSLYLAE